MVAAYRFELVSKSSLAGFGQSHSRLEKSPAVNVKDFAVMLNIDRRENWWTNIAPGSWTRIVTNIVGESKFCAAHFRLHRSVTHL